MTWVQLEYKITNCIEQIKQHPLLDASIKTLLKAIPGVGDILVDWYENIEGGEKETNQILQFLELLKNQGTEYFDSIKQILESHRNDMINNHNTLQQLSSDLFVNLLSETIETRKAIYEGRIEQNTKLDELNVKLNKVLEMKELFDEESDATLPLNVDLTIESYLTYFLKFDQISYGSEKNILRDYYVPPKMVRVDEAFWRDDDSKIIQNNNKVVFDFDDFFSDSMEDYAIIGSPFGIGKTCLVRNQTVERVKSSLNDINNKDHWIPIPIFLRYGLKDVIKRYDLKELLTIFSTIAKDRKFFLLLDGLDEYSSDVTDLFNQIENLKKQFPFVKKVIITSRLETESPNFKIERYVRLLPFDESGVNQFFKKYFGKNILNHAKLKSYGLNDEEICNPLFCWMFAQISNNDKFSIQFNKNWSGNLQKSLIYMIFIRYLLQGKYKDEAKRFHKDWKKYYDYEKTILRKIAALKQVYKSKLSKSLIKEALVKFDDTSSDKNLLDDMLKPIISSYFYHREDSSDNEIIEFIHRSFQEYLLAEFYLECILEDKPNRLNVGIPSKETIDFLEGLIDLLALNTIESKSYKNDFLNTFKFFENSTLKSFDQQTLSKAQNILVENSEKFFKSEQNSYYKNDVNEKENYLVYENGMDYSHFLIDKWIVFFILNKFMAHDRIDLKKLEEIIKKSGSSVKPYLKNLSNNTKLQNLNLSFADLSGSIFTNSSLEDSNLSYTNFVGSDLSGASLRKTNLIHAIFCQSLESTPATLHQVNLQDSDLSYSKLITVNLSESNLRNANLSYANLSLCDLSGTNLSNANLSHANLSNCKLKMTTLTKTNLSHAILSGLNLSQYTLRDVDLEGAILSNCKLSQKNLSQFNIRRSDLRNVNVSYQDLSNFNLSNLDLTGVNMHKTILKKTNLTNTILSKAKISRAIIEDALLKNCDLSDVEFSSTIMKNLDLNSANMKNCYLSETKLENVDLSNANLSHSRIRGWRLTNVNLKNTDLSYATIESIDLSPYDISQVNLNGAELIGVRLSRNNLLQSNMRSMKSYKLNLNQEDLSNMDLSDLDLTQANLINVNLSGTDLTNSNLNAANLSGANLTDAKLNGTNLSHTNLSRSKLIGTEFKNANLQESDLSNSSLLDVDFSNADLTFANLRGVTANRLIINENTNTKHVSLTKSYEPHEIKTQLKKFNIEFITKFIKDNELDR